MENGQKNYEILDAGQLSHQIYIYEILDSSQISHQFYNYEIWDSGQISTAMRHRILVKYLTNSTTMIYWIYWPTLILAYRSILIYQSLFSLATLQHSRMKQGWTWETNQISGFKRFGKMAFSNGEIENLHPSCLTTQPLQRSVLSFWVCTTSHWSE